MTDNSPVSPSILARCSDLPWLTSQAAALRDAGHGATISYSRKVFIPLTHLCRDVCHYCTFAEVPRKDQPAYLSPDQVLAIARAGVKAGCHEALFTLGDKPELRYSSARAALQRLGHETTLSYLAAMCELVIRETDLLPHVNPGVMSRDEVAMLRRVSVSQGIMLENISERLCEKGQVHHGSPDKHPRVRLETIRFAGELQVPFTSGILIGIGETREERIASLLALRDLHSQYDHIQEIIIQNFRAKANTKLSRGPEPDLDELRWTIAVARLIFGAEMNIQAPPNLTPQEYPLLIDAGINDWGGVSPVTPDYVNPEAPWPQIAQLQQHTEAMGKELVERLAVYPAYCRAGARWLDPGLHTRVLRAIDGAGFARSDAWSPGELGDAPLRQRPIANSPSAQIERIIARAYDGERLHEADITALFNARGRAFDAVCAGADELRQRASGDTVRYVVNRNINYTNVCYFKCRFCAFSKGKHSENLRGSPYDLALEEVSRRALEAWQRGATEVCMQGGIHPDYTGATYIALCRAVKSAVPDMHIHAFSALEVTQGAKTLGIPVGEFLLQLRDAGLATLPGTAAEILDDEVRNIICPDKVTTEEWLQVMETAHGMGLRTTSTIMFGHVDGYQHWARHLLRIRDLQARTGGFTEFVPLPFVHMEAPIYLQGKARKGPSFREVLLMHAVSRLALHPLISNIQVSWVKLGSQGVQACLNAGANDLGGTLMNESISRAAGSSHGQEMAPEAMEALIRSAGRVPLQRTTLYQPATAQRRELSFSAQALTPIIQTPAHKYARNPGDRVART